MKLRWCILATLLTTITVLVGYLLYHIFFGRLSGATLTLRMEDEHASLLRSAG